MGSAVQDLEEEQRLLMLCLVAASSILCILDTTKLESVQAMSVQARSLFLRLLTPCHHACLIKQSSIFIDFEEVVYVVGPHTQWHGVEQMQLDKDAV